MRHLLKTVLLLLVFFVGALLYLGNRQSVVFDFYLASVELPIILLLVIAVIMGVVLGIVVSLPMLGRLKRQGWQLRRQLKDCRKELDKLRVFPLKNER